MLCGVLNGSERVAEPTVTSKISNGFHKKLPCMQNVAKHLVCKYFIILHMKFDNLQYNTLVRWFAGTNDSSTNRLMFQDFFS